ncbi:phage tail terminator family protein [Helicovermis profundi]|uniref:Uncharacterized protein n=1 Tax=Helicovermis profundi TaxID=3065157 RepID=A0AAU9E618_9FIRM|nr:hypothetical protein HLPR_11440 [Clostridia bacterium S502]
MIANIKDIKLAINKAIKTISTSKIISSDIEEGFKRPCFKVIFGDVDTESIGIYMLKKDMIVRIYYYPEDRDKNDLELMNIQDSLALLFLDPLIVSENFIIHPLEYVDRLVDNVLQASFELNYIQELDKEDSSLMIDTIELEI